MVKSNISNSELSIEIGTLEIRRHVPILYTFSRIFKMKNTNVSLFPAQQLFSWLKTYLKDIQSYNIGLKKELRFKQKYLLMKGLKEAVNCFSQQYPIR